MGKKSGDFGFRHFAGGPFVMKKNKASNPIDVGLFRANAEMFAPYNVANFIQQFGFVLQRSGLYARDHVPHFSSPTLQRQAD